VQYAGGGGGGGTYVTHGNSNDATRPNGWGVAGGGDGGHNWYQTYPQFSLLSTNARPNTGSGGGGGAYIPAGPWTYGGSGGSGVVVIRYLSTFPAAVSVTGNPEAYVAGPYRVYVWSKSGSITF
jgi:hypothetical protein